LGKDKEIDRIRLFLFRSQYALEHLIVVSKLTATSITYPYIVIKSRMHLKDSDDENQRYSSVLDGFKKILKTEGVAGLYKGIESKLLQSVLTSAFIFALKEEIFKTTLLVLKNLKLRE
jgi:adenine nucleotide transporter 17